MEVGGCLKEAVVFASVIVFNEFTGVTDMQVFKYFIS